MRKKIAILILILFSFSIYSMGKRRVVDKGVNASDADDCRKLLVPDPYKKEVYSKYQQKKQINERNLILTKKIKKITSDFNSEVNNVKILVKEVEKNISVEDVEKAKRDLKLIKLAAAQRVSEILPEIKDETKLKNINDLLNSVSEFSSGENKKLNKISKNGNLLRMLEQLELIRGRVARYLTLIEGILYVDDFVTHTAATKDLFSPDKISQLQSHIGKEQANELLGPRINLVHDSGLSWTLVYTADQNLIHFQKADLFRRLNNLMKLNELLNEEKDQVVINVVFLKYKVPKDLNTWFFNHGIKVHNTFETL